jgi:hypothetical protein
MLLINDDFIKNIVDGQVNLSIEFKYIMKLIIRSECDEQPIYLPENQKENLKNLLAKALNRNQILILSEIENSSRTITSTLMNLSKTMKIPLSTLKLNAKILKQMNLILFNDFSNVELTNFGKFVFTILGGRNPR